MDKELSYILINCFRILIFYSYIILILNIINLFLIWSIMYIMYKKNNII